jgi:plastocyanin
VVALAVLLAAAAAVGGSQIADGASARSRHGDLVVSAKGVRFSPTQLRVANGELRARVKNRDLFWHTFTIDSLGVDLRIPVGATRTVAFEAPAGRYEFYCRIPGHKQAGMKGTLVVR